VKSLVIRRGSPDCNWGHRVSDLGQEQMELCFSEFRKHCLRRHDLREWDMTSHLHLDLEKWMPALIKT
jgi:hypothetical protein